MANSRSKVASRSETDKVVKFFKAGNLLRIALPDVRSLKLVQDCLTYSRRYTERQLRAPPVIRCEEIACYTTVPYQNREQVLANLGHLQRAAKMLKENGYIPKLFNTLPDPEPDRFVPRWDKLDDLDFRPRQKETVEAVAKAIQKGYGGQVWWATGTGKTWLIPYLCMLFPKCTFVITTKHLPVLETIYNRLAVRLPDVGMVSSRAKQRGHRIVCVSAMSLHHAANWNPDILIADEHHELATKNIIPKLAAFKATRRIGMSANFEQRWDNADFELEGIFGPLLSSLSYDDAVRLGLVVPIYVFWRRVDIAKDPCAGYNSDVSLLRHGVWRNDERNKLIAADARSFGKDEQVLITVRTLEHACALKKHLPEFSLCYSHNDGYDETIDQYIDWGWLPDNEPKMTPTRLTKMREQFERGDLKKVIATSVWNRGVSFDYLQVLIRADASSSAIDDTQIPGRVARLSSGKQCGIIIDYQDQFNDSLHRKSRVRDRNYEEKKWQRIKQDLGQGLQDQIKKALEGKLENLAFSFH